MELTLQGLKQSEQWKKAGYSLPEYDIPAAVARTRENPRWIHFGAGNIFRAFQANAAQELLNRGVMDTGLIAAEGYDYEIIEKMYRPHDNLSILATLRADGAVEKTVVGSILESLILDSGNAAEYDRLKEIFRTPSLQMASFTITEKGYSLTSAKGETPSDIAYDFTHGPEAPRSYLGKVSSLVYERYLAGALPLSLVSMDNCSHNGERLKGSVITMAQEWLSRGFVDPGFVDYITDESQVSFPWSMIDKITPRPAESVAAELKKLGVEDMDPVITSKKTYIAPFVNAEGPQYLVIEDHFPNGRPALEKAGVYMTDRDTVNNVERMKVTTCLNPLHTALAVYGCLLGYTLIADEMGDEDLVKLVNQIGPVEGMPVVVNPGILSPEDFVGEVIHDRLPNPFMPDTPQRIACDTSQKVGIRYGETIKSYVSKDGNAGKLTAIPLAIAGWCRYLLGVDDEGKAFELSPDPMLSELTEKLAGIEAGKPESYQGQLKEILSNANIFGSDLYEAGIGDKIETMFKEELAGPGAVRATLKKYLN